SDRNVDSVPFFNRGSSNLIDVYTDQRIAFPRDSYLVKYFDRLDAYFRTGPPLYFVAKDTNITDRSIQQSVCGRFSTCSSFSLANILEQERKRPGISYVAQPTSIWLDDFFHWLNPAAEMCCRFKISVSEPELCEPTDDEDECTACYADRTPAWNITLTGLPEGREFLTFMDYWLQSTPAEDCPLAGSAAYGDAIVVDRERVSVLASHFRTYYTPLKTQADYIGAFRASNRIAKTISDKASLEVFPYSPFHIF